MKKFLSLAVLCFATAIADEATPERLPVGIREVPIKERMEIQQQRFERAQQASTKMMKGMSIEYTSHTGAFHHPIFITPLGDTIELEDGSIWAVHPNDRFKTYNWLTSDAIKITPNHAWFSSYTFRITNLNTSESVEVNLFMRPIYNGVYTHWIVAIDYIHNQLCLEDGSVWDLSGFDYMVFKNWILNDTLIIGTNDTLFSSRPNILINCDTNSYIEARCFN